MLKFFVIYLFFSAFGGYIAKAQYGSADSSAGSANSDVGSADSSAGSANSDVGSADSSAGSANSDAGSAGAEANLQANLTLLGCPPNVDINAGGNTTSGSVNANVTVSAWEEYCKCLKEQLKVNGSVDTNGISANASTPTITCKNPNEESTKEYGYILYVERGSTSTILSNRGVSLTYPDQKRHDKNDANQKITYETTIDAEHPWSIYGMIIANDINLYPIYQQRPINICSDKCEEETWECIVLKIWNLGLTEHGKCPQKPATFHISQTLPPLRVTLPDDIPCGNYSIRTFAENSNKKWALEVYWYFDIITPDCIWY